jgi:hypothetical protein
MPVGSHEAAFLFRWEKRDSIPIEELRACHREFAVVPPKLLEENCLGKTNVECYLSLKDIRWSYHLIQGFGQNDISTVVVQVVQFVLSGRGEDGSGPLFVLDGP